MKKDYMKPSMTAIKLQHSTPLLTGSGDKKGLQSSGWDNPEDELDLSDQGGGSSILDR